ncbi:hypothetical protein [Lacibacter sediminis]|uniref:Outer membrane beta-barrel protein n=1 Tax=Lacibacter sediminis TaxID=2760713 RepID=A0A7G5XE70_9BACT|nr:hypothetical protein [Lacibacter sediminis]QNA43773.1 hypothetical protein H4075_17065 [Lacibacter sediminis]
MQFRENKPFQVFLTENALLETLSVLLKNKNYFTFELFTPIMRQLTLLFATFISLLSNAQHTLPQRHLQLYAGPSLNGTGDVIGFAYDSEFGKYFNKKSSWFVGIGGTIHDKQWPIFYTDQQGNEVDASVRGTIAGVQIAGLYGYSIVRSEVHELLLKIGPILRYQSTSYWDELGVYPPAGTGFPIPLVSFFNTSPQRTLAIGGNVGFVYNYTISKKISIGVLAELQLDTNGDTISQCLLSVGRRF